MPHRICSSPLRNNRLPVIYFLLVYVVSFVRLLPGVTLFVARGCDFKFSVGKMTAHRDFEYRVHSQL